jgi:epoxyqueuosine reductase
MASGRLTWRLERWASPKRPVKWLIKKSDKGLFAWVPPLPEPVLKVIGTEPPVGPKSLAIPPVPEALRREPGIHIDPELERASYERGRVPEIDSWFPMSRKLNRKYMWIPRLMGSPARVRSERRTKEKAPVRQSGDRGSSAAQLSPAALSKLVKDRAAELGVSATGVTEVNPKWTWDVVKTETLAGDRLIICVLEQNYKATQTIPSITAERAAMACTHKVQEQAYELVQDLRKLGFAAQLMNNSGVGPIIAYAVAAGLGQLGLNGQLLSPFSGSRCRLVMISTDAPLALDSPVDYGITGVCDECKVCVRRCPTGAIPVRRSYHRGVEKIKIKIERCVPMTSQFHGCAVCMKVCPIQKFGLPAVLNHYKETGEILGKGTDELEGYNWPGDGKHYGPGTKPRSAVTKEFLWPGGIQPIPLVPWPD